MRIGSFIKVESSYQNLIGRNWDVEKGDYILSENQSLMASLSLIKQIGRIINAQLFYQQRNVSNPFKFDRTESTIMGYHAGIEIGSGLMLNYTFQRSFRDLDGDGDVDSPDETINLITIETSFTL